MSALVDVYKHAHTFHLLPYGKNDAATPKLEQMPRRPTSSIFWKVFLGFRCAVVTTAWVSHLFFANIALSALLPASALFPDLCYNLSSRIAESVWRGVQTIFTRVNHANIILSGADKLPARESAIVISNHVEWTDFYMIQELAIHTGMLGRCRWFAKQQLKWVPFLGWGLWAMGMPLVSRNWMRDQKEIDRVFRGVVERQWPICACFLLLPSPASRFELGVVHL
jgi:1-acyl-sn-glycerol-3-phosphate acyltransferase